MLKTVKAAVLISAVAIGLISCSKNSNVCIGCGENAELERFEFPEGVTVEDLEDIFSDVQTELLSYKGENLSTKQKICFDCRKDALDAVGKCFRCGKLIYRDQDKSVQVCEDCSEYLTEYIESLMVYIPAEDASDGELTDFYVSKFETTQEFYKMIMGTNPSFRKGKNRPVECVHNTEIEEFCTRLSEITDKNYRLLSDKEFDFLTKDISFNSKETLNEIAWSFFNSSEVTHEVGTTRKSTEYELYDLIGNVFETVLTENGEYRRRGGSYVNSLYKSKPDYEAYGADINLCDKGFRVAHDAE